MTLRMADGPVDNLPPGLDAYAGYVDDSGIGVTWPQVSAIPAPYHLSIATHGAPAMCADCETGAMKSWAGYPVGYCSVTNYGVYLRNSGGRPAKLWTAHYTNAAHICGPNTCGALPFTADGTQWTDHTGAWDESLLLDNFFDFLGGPPPMITKPFQWAGQYHAVGVSRGMLAHWYFDGSAWHVEDVAAAAGHPATFDDQVPGFDIGSDGILRVTAVDAGTSAWWFYTKTASGGGWGASLLP